MENKTSFMEPLFEKAEAYGKTSFELFKLSALEKTAVVSSTFVSRGTFVLFLSMFSIIVNIGIALWLGDILGKNYYGFFCIAGFYAIISVIVYFFLHNWIRKSVSNSIISQVLNEKP